MYNFRFFMAVILLFLIASCNRNQSVNSTNTNEKTTIRFASYNVALYRNEANQLRKDLKTGTDKQIQNVAAVIQHIRPDVLALLEFDYDESGQLLQDFQKNYLSVGQHGQLPIDYPYVLPVPSNTGVPSGADYNNDGKIALPNDAYGFGRYEGQYAFALLSKYPIEKSLIRSYQHFLWQNMPNHKKPVDENNAPYYSENAWKTFRLSSKNHMDIPVKLPNGKLVHTIIAHPTPPVFDGPEDRNGLRNYDEIRLLKDYISGAKYLVDDSGNKGGLSENANFVIMGDLNADPIDGDSAPGAIAQLLDDPNVNQLVSNGSLIPKSKGGKMHNRRKGDKGDPAFDTAFFGARIDYVLPSAKIKATASDVFWPAEGEPLYDAVKNKSASDHLLVWLDLEW